MMGFSLGHLIIVLVIVLLFGGRRLPELGGALGKGLRSFKRGIEGNLDEDEGEKSFVSGPSDEKKADKKEDKKEAMKAENTASSDSSEKDKA